MVWTVEHDREVLLERHVAPDFLEWLFEQVEDPVIARMDVYGDSLLEAPSQERWLRALRRYQEAAKADLKEHHLARTRLPRDPEARERALATLVERDFGKQPHLDQVKELEALIELAFAEGARIRVRGD